MEKLFNDAKDKNVSAVYVYGKADDTKAYVDAAGTKQLKTSELKEAFLKRAIIVIGDEMFMPIKLTISSKVASIWYVTPNKTTSTQADIASLVAVAD